MACVAIVVGWNTGCVGTGDARDAAVVLPCLTRMGDAMPTIGCKFGVALPFMGPARLITCDGDACFHSCITSASSSSSSSHSLRVAACRCARSVDVDADAYMRVCDVMGDGERNVACDADVDMMCGKDATPDATDVERTRVRDGVMVCCGAAIATLDGGEF